MADLDLDAKWVERSTKQPTKRIRVMGEWHQLPADIPLAFSLAQMQYMDLPVEERTPDFALDLDLTLANTLFGRKVVQGWIDGGMQRGQLTETIVESVLLITGGPAEAEEETDPPKV